MTPHSSDKKGRASFATRLGAIATAVGSAVGLGNIWRFPYEAGTHGGGAFLLLYISFIIIIGLPLMCAEFSIGRAARANAVKAFVKLSGSQRWAMLGALGILASILILSFYSVVAGWTLEYLFLSLTRGFEATDSVQLHNEFTRFISNPWQPLMFTWIFLGLNYLILARGVRGGIERLSNIMMPVLFLILIIFCINSLTLPGASRGLKFLFSPDFSQITPAVVLSAMGQAFFSLSLGLGCMLTYGSYFKNETPIPRTALTIGALDTLVAILSGIIIFPAVFSFNLSPQAGPTLVFETLPAIFGALPAGFILAPLFFFLLFLASITSTISMAEISISFCSEKLQWSRRKATLFTTGIALALSALCALSFGPLSHATICSLSVFNLFDYLSSNIILPIGGMFTALFAGWVFNRDTFSRQLTYPGNIGPRTVSAIRFCLRYVIPICIIHVFLDCIGLI